MTQPMQPERTVSDKRFLLVAPSGVSALVSSWGAGLVALHGPDRDGRFADVVLGFDTAAEYAAGAGLYFGCTVGRVSNRIKGARFELDGRTVQLAANDGRNHLHGGPAHAFDRVPWAATTERTAAGDRVTFARVSPDGEEGYPGRLEVRVSYTLTSADELWLEVEARTDTPTPVSITNHTYWNLAGAGSATVVDHELQVFADRYTPTDAELIPTGAIESVEGTPLDFRQPTRLGAGIDQVAAGSGRGYDHNYVLPGDGSRPVPAARLHDPGSGRMLEVLATQPCLQVYSGNMMRPSVGKFGSSYAWRSAICLEPQGYPNAVNEPRFPSVLLHPGEVYRTVTIFRLTTDQARP